MSIGTILKTKYFLKFSAYSDNKYLMRPFSMWEAWGSPGWTLEVITIAFFCEWSLTYWDSLCPNPSNYGAAVSNWSSLNSKNWLISASIASCSNFLTLPLAIRLCLASFLTDLYFYLKLLLIMPGIFYWILNSSS